MVKTVLQVVYYKIEYTSVYGVLRSRGGEKKMANAFEVLGIAPESGEAEIRKASGSNADPADDVLPMEIELADGTVAPAISWIVSEDDWIKEVADDGRICYYHKKPVKGGNSTAMLFEEVHFAKEMGNEYQNCKVLIDVSAEAVQTANNPIPDKAGSDVTDVDGWPTE